MAVFLIREFTRIESSTNQHERTRTKSLLFVFVRVGSWMTHSCKFGKFV